MSELKDLWKHILEDLHPQISDVHLNTWLKPLEPIVFIQNTIYLDTKNGFIGSLVKNKYLSLIRSSASKVLNRDVKVVLTNSTQDDYQNILNLESDSNEINNNQNITIDDFNQNGSKRENDINENISNINLNPRYTFDTFVSGKSNEFAMSAAMQIAHNPGRVYNPLFIYGGSGLGKTHLMQAIAHEIIKKDKENNFFNHPVNILYISSEDFTNQIIKMISMKDLSEKEVFRQKYRQLDVLLIDDIQFLANKDATIEEFFHIFNALKENNKQIVISADKHPKDLKNIEERLITRFQGGLSVDIQPPNFETRVAIINRKLQIDKTSLPQAIVELIAQGETTSIRALEGDLLKVQAIANAKNIDFNIIDENEGLSLARQVLNLKSEEKKKITIDEILYVIEDEYDVSLDKLTSRSRQSTITNARQIAMYLCRKLTDLSLVRIGDAFNRDHTTVMHSIDKVESHIKEDQIFKMEIDSLVERIRN